MLTLSLFNMILSTTFSLLFSNTPIALGMTILLLATQMSLLLSLASSSWFSLLLFLIYIGGLLVMFSYFSALTPNHPTTINRPLLIFVSSFILISTLSSLTLPTPNHLPLNPPPTLSLTYLFISKNLPLLLFLTLILFLALILVVKISSRSAGPLRPFSL